MRNWTTLSHKNLDKSLNLSLSMLSVLSSVVNELEMIRTTLPNIFNDLKCEK